VTTASAREGVDISHKGGNDGRATRAGMIASAARSPAGFAGRPAGLADRAAAAAA
jgi:hypothetical protein